VDQEAPRGAGLRGPAKPGKAPIGRDFRFATTVSPLRFDRTEGGSRGTEGGARSGEGHSRRGEGGSRSVEGGARSGEGHG